MCAWLWSCIYHICGQKPCDCHQLTNQSVDLGSDEIPRAPHPVSISLCSEKCAFTYGFLFSFLFFFSLSCSDSRDISLSPSTCTSR